MNTPKRIIFWVVLFSIPFVAFLMVEGLLRAVDYGDAYPLFVASESHPDYYRIYPNLGSQYFPASGVSPAVAHLDLLLRQKPRGSFRIFVLGGSTAAGYPYLYNGSFSSILKAILAARYPQVEIEIVNLAMTAVSSFTVRDIGLKLGPYQPDLVLIYAGHNEFYGGLGVGSTERLSGSRSIINLYLRLNRLRSFQLLRNMVLRLKGIFPGTEIVEQGTLMQRMAGEKLIAVNDPLCDAAVDNLYGNLSDVVDYLSAGEIPLMIATLTSNVHDQKPFVDVFSAGTPPAGWNEELAAARRAIDASQWELALGKVADLIAADSIPATPHFLRGIILEAMGQPDAAKRAFYTAKENDGLRFRASERMNRAIERLAAHPCVTVVPVMEAFEKASPLGIPGNSLMLEHLHPNLQGYILMAESFAGAIDESGLAGQPAAAPDTLWRRKIGVTRLDSLAAAMRIGYLLSGWPFTDKAPAARDIYGQQPGDSLSLIASDFWYDRINWEEMHVRAAEYYTQRDDVQNAAEAYRALIHASPMNESPFLLLANLYLGNERPGEALKVLEDAAESTFSADVMARIGAIYRSMDKPRQGIVYLKKAIETGGRGNDLYKLELARCYHMNQEIAKSRMLLREIAGHGSGAAAAEAARLLAQP